MQPSPICSECGSPIPPDAPLGLCPRCLIDHGRRGGVTGAIPPADSPEPGAGTRIGPYTVLGQIGEGGFGIVLLAEQRRPIARQVALKILKEGMDTRQVIARFEAERQALAMMEHPNIAKVLDAGATEGGRPYFVMERVDGIPLVRYCNEHRLGARERLELFMDVCSAVQHAHQKGVIHRDLKPSNILVTTEGARPVPKVIDFGIAKATGPALTERTLFTRLDQFVGTPFYISPEQARLGATDIDTRSDIYSLGVILYELLTGKPPLDPDRVVSAGLGEMLRMIRETEVPRPSTRLGTMADADLRKIAAAHDTEPRKLGLFLRGDLDWIVLKAIEKDRSRRYDTANALRLDLGRFLADEPVSAVAPSRVYRLRKFARRHRGPLTAGALLLAAIVAGSAASIHQGVRATREARRSQELLVSADAAREVSDRTLYRMAVLLAQRDLKDERISDVNAMLEAQIPGPGDTDRRGWEWFYLRSRMDQSEFTLATGQKGLRAVAWDTPGNRFAVAGEDGRISIWNHGTRQPIKTFGRPGEPVWALAWNPRHPDLLASGGAGGDVTLWSVSRAAAAWRRHEHPDTVRALAWNPAGDLLASGDLGGELVVADRSLGLPVARETIGRKIRSLAWNPMPESLASDGRIPASARDLLAAGIDARGIDYRAIGLWSYQPQGAPAPSPGPLHWIGAYRTPRGLINSISWSATGDSLAGFSEGFLFVLDNPPEWRVGDPRTAHLGQVGVVAFHPRSSRLASASNDRTVKLWDLERREPVATLRGHRGPITAVAWNPAGTRLLTCGLDRSARIWAPDRADADLRFHRARDSLSKVTWRPDGREIAIACWRPKVWILDGETGRVLRSLSGHRAKVADVEWSPDGKRLATASYDGEVRIWDDATGRTLQVLEHEEKMDRATWSPDGHQLVTRSWYWNDEDERDGMKLYLWTLDGPDGPTRRVLRCPEDGDSGYPPCYSLAWHPENPWLATGTTVGRDELIIWDTRNDRILARREEVFPRRRQGISAIEWSPDGRSLALGGGGGHVATLDFAEGRLGRLHFMKQVFIGGFAKVAWSPDQSRLAGWGADGSIRILDPQSGERFLDLLDPLEDGEPSEVFDVEWSPDGRRLVSGSFDCWVRMWDASKGYAEDAK